MNCRNCGCPSLSLYHCPTCHTTLAARGDEASEWGLRTDQHCVPVAWVNRRTGQMRPIMVMHWTNRSEVVA